MIPKIIHYCWFGEKSLPKFAQNYIAGWKKLCPDYEIRLCNEQNFDVNSVPFTAQVAKAKKWGFIVDYLRAYLIYNYGGIYLDVDVELLKPFDENMLQNKCFGGFESGFLNENLVNPGNIFAGEKGNVIAKEIINFYSSYNFINENGELNLTPSPKIFTKILMKYGLKNENTYQELGEFTAYPAECFCPKSYVTGLTKITQNTISIHHYDASWVSADILYKQKIIYAVFSLFGDNFFTRFLLSFYYCCEKYCTRLTNLITRFFVKLGPVNTIKYYWNRVFNYQGN